ncbi:hypothetical protein Halha_2140 [Halobacteroides halobius DSM 5150]|uniref:Uncharacterized protein n=1 Tax=Halobacteroides halobius (strain ATCC 35273 / DSM 5150 / MD-1) TaxID=748449 RepID=L0KD56_HALHC|nr:hypothetical protein [Halobacteroides halobius]AGB42023.1 hypothetical protein Halha_2140 [Halobacteroides halobius DSM 5150]
MSSGNGVEKALWSVAIPGFGQLLNRNYFKGVLLIGLEVLINGNANLNSAIIASFYGDMEVAINQVNYQWLMFYPCIYMFAIWDAYQVASKDQVSYLAIPFIISSYLGTIGVIYSPTLRIFGVLLGPVFLPILFICLGLGIGFIIRSIINNRK